MIQSNTTVVHGDGNGHAVRAVVRGMFLVTVSAGIAAAGDPDLEPGFPVQAWHGAGSYHSGQAIHVLVGNIDADDELEILMTALSTGPVYAWNADGSQVFGWPVAGGTGVGYVALGQLSIAYAGLEAAVGYWGDELVAYAGDGSVLPGWPVSASNYISTPPALGDVDGDGLDEFFIGEEDWKLHAYRADGTVLPGWPTSGFVGGQERHTPAIADLDGDGDLDLATANGIHSVSVLFNNGDGTFVTDSTYWIDDYPISVFAADLDGDSDLDLATANWVSNSVSVLLNNGDGTFAP
ncbi:MAG: VCBS repeat-containing protein, partial [Phycisphaerales bacterium]|nr:VCBS repeat-containing protein [Phycisphaerales bacterium]